ncbi:MAG: ATP-grasp domain-containing protein [Bdellovibrionaceae bacterium]|nr:ATP-grasp domain-containing protein [Bdellovibrionales bacterium]MCB9086276.1 ATP-grasp domain-containing protein [Pseudobdellovibrionaceae bacterium]
MRGKIAKVAIANRGEVAVRIIRACQELGIETVLLHSEADKATLAYRLADEVVCVGPAPTGESYLNIDTNIHAALSVGADAIHPGFGFLSENADFAEACNDNRIVFIGPSPEAIRLFGDKISAKKLVEEAGGPVIPGYQGEDQSEGRLLKEIEKIGLPAMVKAAGGGGGRGLKVVHSMDQAAAAIESAKREGQSAFGSDRVFLEKYLSDAKHIEVQIFGDCSGKVYHLFDRECSVQRRHQKIIEEAVSPALSDEKRRLIAQTAVKIAEAAKYQGAGTVEFLYQDGEFYFMEMNTRLQVEHPVTEMVMGVDLVKAQLLTAMGQSLGWPAEPEVRGHAIECRLYAEDPYKGGIPSTGQLGSYSFPHGPGRRLEIGFEPGDEVTSFYDPMIAKVIVWDENRPRAIQKMIRTLKDTVIFGVKTNIPFLIEMLSHVEFVEGTMTTKFVETHFPQGLKRQQQSTKQQILGDELFRLVASSRVGSGAGSSATDQGPSPWAYQWSQQ